MAKTPKKPAKTKKRAAPRAVAAEPRLLQKPEYQSFRLSKRIKGERLPGAFQLLADSTRVLARNWKLFLGITLIYAFLNALLVQGFSIAGNIEETKSAADQSFNSGGLAQFASSFTVFTYLMGTSGNTASLTATTYQSILILVVGLAVIWALRQVYAGNKIRVRDSFYLGMAPLIPYVLVLAAIIVQLLPIALGLLVYTTVVSSGIAVTTLDFTLWALMAFATSLLSLYLVSSSIFASYLVTLPETAPMQALRSARQLVKNRRWAVIRKILFLPVALGLLAALVVIPVIMLATPLAPWVFFAVTMVSLPIAHSYMYALYRSLL